MKQLILYSVISHDIVYTCVYNVCDRSVNHNSLAKLCIAHGVDVSSLGCAVLLCLVVCSTLLASSFLRSASLINMYTNVDI